MKTPSLFHNKSPRNISRIHIPFPPTTVDCVKCYLPQILAHDFPYWKWVKSSRTRRWGPVFGMAMIARQVRPMRQSAGTQNKGPSGPRTHPFASRRSTGIGRPERTDRGKGLLDKILRAPGESQSVLFTEAHRIKTYHRVRVLLVHPRFGWCCRQLQRRCVDHPASMRRCQLNGCVLLTGLPLPLSFPHPKFGSSCQRSWRQYYDYLASKQVPRLLQCVPQAGYPLPLQSAHPRFESCYRRSSHSGNFEMRLPCLRAGCSANRRAFSFLSNSCIRPNIT
jgi:hypothetical protein